MKYLFCFEKIIKVVPTIDDHSTIVSSSDVHVQVRILVHVIECTSLSRKEILSLISECKYFETKKKLK